MVVCLPSVHASICLFIADTNKISYITCKKIYWGQRLSGKDIATEKHHLTFTLIIHWLFCWVFLLYQHQWMKHTFSVYYYVSFDYWFQYCSTTVYLSRMPKLILKLYIYHFIKISPSWSHNWFKHLFVYSILMLHSIFCSFWYPMDQT